MSKAEKIQSVLVSVEVLNTIAALGGSVRPAQIARALKMTLPRVLRHLSTLEETGLVIQSEYGDGYRLGWKLLQLGKAAENQNTLADIARPSIETLSQQTGETVILSIPANHNAVVIECKESQRLASITLRIGQTLRLPLSPTTRVLLAFRSAEEQESDLDQIDAQLLDQSGFDRAGLIRHGERVRDQLFDADPNPHGTGIGVVAAPVFGDQNRCVAVVSLMLPSTRLSDPPDPALLEPLFRCAATVSYRLGSTEVWAARGFEKAWPLSASQDS